MTFQLPTPKDFILGKTCTTSNKITDIMVKKWLNKSMRPEIFIDYDTVNQLFNFQSCAIVPKSLVTKRKYLESLASNAGYEIEFSQHQDEVGPSYVVATLYASVHQHSMTPYEIVGMCKRANHTDDILARYITSIRK